MESPDRADEVVAALERLAPPNVSWDVAGPRTTLEPLRDGESGAVARAVAKRQHEFRAGRHCAHRALFGLGISVESVPAGVDRAPVWPSGVTGSISHSGRLGTTAVAVAACVSDWRSLGIDVEVRGATSRLEITQIANAVEVAEQPRDMRTIDYCDALFTTKEAAFKALYPLLGRFLEFQEVTVVLESGRFRARLVEPRSNDAVAGVEGVWTATPSWNLALALLPPSSNRA